MEIIEYYDPDAKKDKKAYKCSGCNKTWKYKTDCKKCEDSNHTYNNLTREV